MTEYYSTLQEYAPNIEYVHHTTVGKRCKEYNRRNNYSDNEGRLEIDLK